MECGSLRRKFIQNGKTGQIEENPAGYAKLYKMLRSFPDGIRNCYNLSVEKGRTYLMRATFVYGNHDVLDIKAVFDLYLGPNPWTTIDLERVNGTRKGILHIPTSKRPSMSQVIHELKECIVCENSGISKNPGLELEDMNITLDTSVVLSAR